MDKDKKVLWDRTWDFGLVFAVFSISTVFWFISAPLVRYGYAYITVVPLLMFGQLFIVGCSIKRLQAYAGYIHKAFCVILLCFLLTRFSGLITDIQRTWKEPYYFAQTDYVDGDAEIRVVDGITFYVPTELGHIGYKKFPSSVFAIPFELRGESIEDGFRQPLTE